MNTGSLRDRLREATSREILEAAEAVLAEQGFAAASMASIAQRAGVSVGTLYNYFKDKDQLLATILSVRRQEIAARLDELQRQYDKTSFAVHLEAFVRSTFQMFDFHRKFLRIVLETERLARPDEDAGHKKRTFLIDRVTPIVEKGVAEGRLKRGGATLYPALFAGAMRGALGQILDHPEIPIADQSQLVIEFFLAV